MPGGCQIGRSWRAPGAVHDCQNGSARRDARKRIAPSGLGRLSGQLPLTGAGRQQSGSEADFAWKCWGFLTVGCLTLMVGSSTKSNHDLTLGFVLREFRGAERVSIRLLGFDASLISQRL